MKSAPPTSLSPPTILVQNADFIVINKPAGWLSIPAREPKPSDRVITEWLKEEQGIEPWTIHRLDRYTSGAIVFARSKSAHAEGNRWFEKKLVKKIYHFLAAPHPGSLLPGRPAVQIKTPVDGKPSQTLFEVISKAPKIFYGKATPITGRFHQVREHAQEGKFPLLGDHSYGFNSKLAGLDFPRVALHAFELTLPFAKVEAPIPDDMQTVINLYWGAKP